MSDLKGSHLISKPAAVGLITAGLLLLAIFWNPTISTLAAESWFVRQSRPPNRQVGLMAIQPVPAGQTQDYTGPHGGYHALTEGCATCHRGHSAADRDLTAFWPEEALCFNCHSVEGDATTDMLSLFMAFPNSDTAFFSHPVMEVDGAHDTPILGEGEDLSDRHVECADCHNPHAITPLNQIAPTISGRLEQVAGVEPIYDGPGNPVGYNWISFAQFEYQVCLKCHSSYTVLPEYIPDGWNGNQIIPDGLSKLTNLEPEQIPDSRDLAREFNPSHASFHPVVAAGNNPLIPPESFLEGWSSASFTYCSDCHATQMESYNSAGPHAGQLHILREASPYTTAVVGGRTRLTGTEVCFNCHRAETYLSGGDPVENTNFRRNTRNLHRTHANNASCYQCHDSHGSEQRHLLNLDTSLNDQNPELLIFLAGYDQQPTNSQSFWQISSDGGTKTCFIECHNQNHTRSGWTYPNYMGE